MISRMKHTIRIAFFLISVVLVFSCGMGGRQQDYGYGSSAGNTVYFSEASTTEFFPLHFIGSSSSWEDTGFIPEGLSMASLEGNVPPAYRDTPILFDIFEGNSGSGDLFTPSQNLSAAEIEQGRRLTKEAQLNIRVEDLSQSEISLAELTESYNAWLASTIIAENIHTYTVRVPSETYEAMLSDLAALGRTLRRSETTEDVTLRYYDLESRLATQQELLRTFQSYLARASNIDEIMIVERRIAELQREIDQSGTQFRNLVSRIDYSTIYLNIHGPLSAVSYSRPTIRERLGEFFNSFGEVASSALMLLMGIVIYGVPSLLILIILYWIFFGRVGILRRLWRLAAGKSKEAGRKR